MAKVQTAKGETDVADLGPTLMHEHVFIRWEEMQVNYDMGWNEEDQVAAAIVRLSELWTRGIRSIVDLTVLGLGRNVRRIARIAAQIDLNIIVATGLYTFGDIPFYFRNRGPGTPLGGPDPMAEMFVGDIMEGIPGTKVKAGMLKCATDAEGITPGVERVLRAVAEAHRITGVPISTHTHAPSRRGLDQQKIFVDEGIDLNRVVIGHSGDTTDLDYLEELVGAGSYLGMDRFGAHGLLPFLDRVRVVADMCRLGHSGHMVLSHDACCRNDSRCDPVVAQMMPPRTYTHISDEVLPALLAAGVSQAQIDQMLIDNPRRIFERQGD